MTTTFTSRDKNVDIPTGLWRPLNLQRPPFSFPPPIRLINERCEEGDGLWADKCLGVWDVKNLRGGDASATDAAWAAPPRVSIIIPTYNRANFIGEAVASALGQDYQAIEVIVIDDGSTDATSDVLATFRDPRLVCVHQETSAGRAREIGVSPWRVANTSRSWIRTITIFRRKSALKSRIWTLIRNSGWRTCRVSAWTTTAVARPDIPRVKIREALSADCLLPSSHDHVADCDGSKGNLGASRCL